MNETTPTADAARQSMNSTTKVDPAGTPVATRSDSGPAEECDQASRSRAADDPRGLAAPLKAAEPSGEAEAQCGPWLSTFTGKRFHLLDPRPDDVDIADVAHALSMLCRYNGHCPYFYSVAEHSVACAHEAARRGAGPAEQLAVLLHDAAEAYTGDLISPLKACLRTRTWSTASKFDDIERDIEWAVKEHFNLGPLLTVDAVALLRAVDLAVGAAECARFGICVTPGREQDAAPDWSPFFWPPELAEKKFLELFIKLTAEVRS